MIMKGIRDERGECVLARKIHVEQATQEEKEYLKKGGWDMNNKRTTELKERETHLIKNDENGAEQTENERKRIKTVYIWPLRKNR